MKCNSTYEQHKTTEKGEFKNETYIRSWSFLFVERASSLGGAANADWPN